MRKYIWAIFVVMLLLVVVALLQSSSSDEITMDSPFHYTFNDDGILRESGEIEESSSQYFWLNSGGELRISNGTGKTLHGALPRNSGWRTAYNLSNPIDTDEGYHPQNIFRLLTRSKWENFQQEIYFKVNGINLSESSQRDISNGVLLLSRYQDEGSVYYAGIRVDGHAIIKKKVDGKYYTLAEKPFYKGIYNRDTKPNLIPKEKWIGLRSVIDTGMDGTVNIQLFIDKDKTGEWTLVVEAVDDDKFHGIAPITNEGYAGIRSDFMDVEFDNYILVKQ